MWPVAGIIRCPGGQGSDRLQTFTLARQMKAEMGISLLSICTNRSAAANLAGSLSLCGWQFRSQAPTMAARHVTHSKLLQFV